MTAPSFYELQQKRALSHLGLNPFPWYKSMRMTNPVSIDEQDQLGELFRYKDVQSVLADPLLFSSKGQFEGDSEGEERGSIVVLDPPRHNKLRALVSQAFTFRSIEQQANNIRTIVNELLDAVSSDTLDVIRDLGVPLPMRVMAGILGVPLSRQADFKRWVQESTSDSPELVFASFQALNEYIRTLLSQRREERQDDLISALLDAQIDGEPLTEQEIVDFCVLLLGAGFETSTHLLGNAFLCLDEHPSAREQLWADPSLLPGAIEEVLRFRPVGHRMNRVVTRDIEIGGKPLKAGYKVFAWVASANRDEEQFPDSETFDIRRSPNKHLSLGSGIHFCLGAPLARMEIKIALEQIIERFKDVQRIQNVPLQLVPSYIFYGVQQLPVRVQKR